MRALLLAAPAQFLFGILTAEYAVEQIDAEHDDEDHNENGTPAGAQYIQTHVGVGYRMIRQRQEDES